MPVSTAARVTVVTPQSRIDVSLPAQSTIAELVPQLVRMAGPDRGARATPTEWAFTRLGGVALDGASTVSGAGIRDGEVLYLNPVPMQPAPLLFDDVVDAIASAAEDRPGVWQPAVSRRLGTAAAALTFSAAAVLLGTAGLRWPAGPALTAVLAVVLLLAGGALARAYGDAVVGAAVAAGGLPASLLAGLAAFGTSGMTRPGMASLSVGFAAASVYAVLAAVVVVGRATWFASAAIAAAIGAIAAAATLGLDARPAAGAAVVIAVCIAVSPLMPMVSLRLGRLPLPRVPVDVAAFRSDERPTLGPEVTDGTEAAEEALTGLLTALAVVLSGCAWVLVHDRDTWAWLLTAITGAVLLLRARAYRRIGQRAALLLAGVGTLVAAGVRGALSDGWGVWATLVAATLVTGVVCVTYAMRAPGRSPSPYWSRLLDIVEFLALVSLVPVAAAVLNVYSYLRGLGG
jgi:type VII secretion integral membrane protein EccD